VANKFPYHYGSHATYNSLKAGYSCAQFPYHYGSHATHRRNCSRAGSPVSIPLWFSRNEEIETEDLREIAVSIPLWFSRNEEICPWIYQWATFPYHYGSHATGTKDRQVLQKLLFPYHYGSHATERKQVFGHYSLVSIPLWFSRNVRT